MLHFLAQTANNFDFETSTQVTSTGDTTMATGILMAIMIGSIISYLVGAFLLGRVFQKAGRPMWPAFVPIYNAWVLLEVAGKPGWWVLINFVPFIGSVIYLILFIVASLELAKRFSKSAVFAVFGLVIFPIIGYAILAFDQSKYSPQLASSDTGPYNGGVPPTDQTQSPQPPQNASV